MSKKTIRGSAIIEMALFIPLAALLFFVGTDAALRATDQAAINDILRSSLTEFRKSLPAPNADSNSRLDLSALNDLLKTMKSKIITNLWPYQSTINKWQEHKIDLAITAIEIEIDRSTGKQEGISQLIPCSSDVEACELIKQHIQNNIESSTGHFSPFAVAQSNHNEDSSGLSYFPQTVLFVAALITPTRSLSPFLTEQLVGQSFSARAVQEIYVTSYER